MYHSLYLLIGFAVVTQALTKMVTFTPQDVQNEGKVQRLIELGFDRATVLQALSLFNGNEEQAASYLFGGF